MLNRARLLLKADQGEHDYQEVKVGFSERPGELCDPLHTSGHFRQYPGSMSRRYLILMLR
jgi:hypothetical protein